MAHVSHIWWLSHMATTKIMREIEKPDENDHYAICKLSHCPVRTPIALIHKHSTLFFYEGLSSQIGLVLTSTLL